MTQARLPYPDDPPVLATRPANRHLNELRALRDSYARRAASALARRWHTKPEKFEVMIERSKVVPIGEWSDGLLIMACNIGDITDWAAVTRFVWLSEKIWDLECQELAGRILSNGD